MRINSSVTKTDRKTQFVSRLDGVDLRKGNSLYKADKCINLINKNGKVVKRNGWRELYKFDAKIDYFEPVIIDGIEYLLVYSGRRFYIVSANSVITDITESAKSEYAFSPEKLVSRTCRSVKKNGIYYIFGAGVYLSLSNFGDGIELRSVKKSAYIPVTTIGIMPESQCVFVKDVTVDDTSRGVWYVKNGNTYEAVTLSDSTPFDPTKTYYNRISSASVNPTKLESENILTPFRKNTLYGVSEQAYYRLDSAVSVDSENEMIVKTLEGNDVNVYRVRVRDGYNEARFPDEGDDLTGKTLTVTANGETVSCSGLQQGLSQKGKVLFKGSNIECYWFSNGITELGWNKASLKLNYYDETGNQKEEIIASAERKNTSSLYAVTYQSKTIKLNSEIDSKIDYSVVHADCDKYITAVLPAYVTPLIDDNFQIWGSLDHKRGRIFLNRSAVSPDGTDNIEFTFHAANSEYEDDTIDNCAICSEFGVDGNTDRVFASGNPKYPNRDFASESEDLTYFPTDFVYKFGLDSTPVIAYARLSDDSQAVFKNAAVGESNVYIRKGKWTSQSVEIGDNSFSFNKAEFGLTGNYLSTNAISQDTFAYMDGEPFFLSEYGVYSLKSSTDILDSRRFAVNRGACVNDQIVQEIAAKHNAVCYDGNYCISIGNKLYIAKSNGYFYENGIKQYNWWIWDNVPAVFLTVVKNELWFGTADGRICRFSSEFYDEYYDKISKGSILFEENDEIVSFSENLELNLNDEIVIDQKVYSSFIDSASVNAGKIVVDDVTKIASYSVYADNVFESGLQTDVEYKIGNINALDNSFSLLKDGEKIDLTSGGFRLSFLLKNETIKVSKLRYSLDSSQNDLCCFTVNGKKVVPIAYDGEPLPESVSGKIIRRKSVIALWKTAKTDLNYPTMLKTVHKVGITLGEKTTGTVKLLCESKSSIMQNFNLGGGIDLLNPNMAGFSFNGSVNKECYARTRFREVGYFDLLIASEDPNPFELKGFSIEYSLLKGKRGIY